MGIRFASKTDNWGAILDGGSRYTADGRIWKTTFEGILDELSKLGYRGFDCAEEDLAPYLRDKVRFKRMAADRGLEFVSSWAWLLPKTMRTSERLWLVLPETDPAGYALLAAAGFGPGDLVEDLKRVRKLADDMVGMGARSITLGGPIIQRKDIHERHYGMVASMLDDLVGSTDRLGLKVALHPHMSTLVQGTDDVERLFDHINSGSIGVCLDTGHVAASGSDVVRFTRKYLRRITHVHLKDFEFRTGRFRELGRGDLKLRAVIKILVDGGYNGWITAETDTPASSPLESDRSNLAFLTRALGPR